VGMPERVERRGEEQSGIRRQLRAHLVLRGNANIDPENELSTLLSAANRLRQGRRFTPLGGERQFAAEKGLDFSPSSSHAQRQTSFKAIGRRRRPSTKSSSSSPGLSDPLFAPPAPRASSRPGASRASRHRKTIECCPPSFLSLSLSPGASLFSLFSSLSPTGRKFLSSLLL